ncbi:hypothetical protein ACI76Y_08325 [Capnocytophaga cynodegmi]|uniref:hypothetical protein n=1 Tax=Capnocytophaga cynodegmi TaxID=28189 RepID=UPI00385DB979
MKKILFLIAAIVMIVACGKSENNPEGGTYTVKIPKAEGVKLLNVAVVYDGKTDTEVVNKALTEDWVKTFTTQGHIAVSVGAKGTNDNSVLKLQLLKGDKVVKESTANGVHLVATISN